MKLRLFHVPVHGGEEQEAALNQLLASVRVLHIEQQFVSNAEWSYWAISVTIDEMVNRPKKSPKRDSVDYKEVLNAEDFALFAVLRQLRKTVSEREGIPVYGVFSNAQLAEMATNAPRQWRV